MSAAPESTSGDTRTAHLEAVLRAIGVMWDRLADPQPLRTLADAATFSPFYFHQMFTEITAVTPARFLAALRMAEARRLLLHSGLPVRQVAARVGYASPGTFSVQFGRLTGTPPSRFRSQARALGDLRAAGTRRWPPPCPRSPGDGPAMILSRAPEPGSLVCACLSLPGSLSLRRGRWAVSTGSPRIPLPTPPGGDYAAFCMVISAGAGVTEALVDDVRGTLRIGRAALSVSGRPAPAVRARLRWPAPTDPPINALLPLAFPPESPG